MADRVSREQNTDVLKGNQSMIDRYKLIAAGVIGAGVGLSSLQGVARTPVSATLGCWDLRDCHGDAYCADYGSKGNGCFIYCNQQGIAYCLGGS